MPIKLRVKIDRLVLKVSGFRQIVGNKSFVAHDEKAPIWKTRSYDAFTMPPIQEFLVLLTVNKNVYEHAMPEFFHQI